MIKAPTVVVIIIFGHDTEGYLRILELRLGTLLRFILKWERKSGVTMNR